MANDVNIFTADLERAVNMLMDIKPYCDGIYCEEFEEYEIKLKPICTPSKFYNILNNHATIRGIYQYDNAYWRIDLHYYTRYNILWFMRMLYARFIIKYCNLELQIQILSDMKGAIEKNYPNNSQLVNNYIKQMESHIF